MQEGFIDNVKVPVYWKEKGFKNSLLPYRKKKQGVRIMLGTGDDWYGGSVSAFLCYKCSIVLITDIAKKHSTCVAGLQAWNVFFVREGGEKHKMIPMGARNESGKTWLFNYSFDYDSRRNERWLMENCFEKPAAISLQPLIVTIYQMISRYQMTIMSMRLVKNLLSHFI